MSAIAVRPSARLVTKSLANRTVTVKVVAGSQANETVVTFTNKGRSGQLKVCKQAASDSPSLVGQPFSFRINGGTSFSVDAGAFGSPNCSAFTGPYAPGTSVSVAEVSAPANTHVSDVSFNGTSLGTNNPVTVSTVAGSNIVTFTNQVTQQPNPGTLEICKYAANSDPYVRGNYTFSVDGGSTHYSVAVGHCTAGITLPAGNHTVTETDSGTYPSTLTSVTTTPAGRVVSKNLVNRSAVFTVVAGDDTQANFYNSAVLGTVKVCKFLASGSEAALSGVPFTFDLNSSAGTSLQPLTLTVANGNNSDCENVPVQLPATSTLTVSERPVDNVQPMGLSSQTITVVGNAVRELDFTNQALGTLKICKVGADQSTVGQDFAFKVNGGSPITVTAGAAPGGLCATPVQVPVGTATISETSGSNYHLVSVTANGGRLTSSSTDNPATVTIPFGGASAETVVTFTNAVNTGEFEICKINSDGNLAGQSFTFGYSYTVNNVTQGSNTSLTPGRCTNPTVLDVPVVNADGSPVVVTVTEAPTTFSNIASITIDPQRNAVSSDTSTGVSSFDVSTGITTVTYDNNRNPIAPTADRFRV